MKRLLFALLLAVCLGAGDVIEYELRATDRVKIQAAYDQVIEAAAEYDAARENLTQRMEEVQEVLAGVKKRYGHGGKRSVEIRGKVVRIELNRAASINLQDGTNTLSWVPTSAVAAYALDDGDSLPTSSQILEDSALTIGQ